MVLLLLLLVAASLRSLALADLELGSCSERCQQSVPRADVQNDTSISHFAFPCSCSPSCTLYNDCCYDSPFRNKEWNISSSFTVCLSVSSRGSFKAVSRCPRDWTESGDFCSEGLGHLPPVTSRASGVTYANVHCALCHRDAANLTRWSVELKCCSGQDDVDGARIYYRRGELWSQAPGRKRCRCSFRADDLSFLQDLELRSCVEEKLEVSRCSPSWQGPGPEEALCRSFLDPVFVGRKLYRNLRCAECNFARARAAACLPDLMQQELQRGGDLPSALQLCRERRSRTCLYYLDSLSSRGRSYTFSSLLNIHEQACLPPAGSRCCKGQRYDFNAKRCRWLSAERD